MGTVPPVLKFQRGLPHSKQYGERLRLLVIQGPDQGTCFSLLGDLLFIGREGAQVQLKDANISRRHAEISWKGDHYTIRDLGSSNGIMHNGAKAAEAKLVAGDIVLVGLSVLEVYAAGQTRKNDAPQIKSLTRRPTGAAIPSAGKPGATAGAADQKKPEEEKKKKEIDKKRLLVYVALAFVAWIAFFSEEEKPQTFRERAKIESSEEPPPPKKKKLTEKEIKEAMSEYNPQFQLDTPQRKDAEIFFRSGVREMQNKNFRRAITAFQTAITVDNSHELAKIYLKTAKKDMEAEIKSISAAELKTKKSLRFKEARMNYENIIRYLEGDTENKMYVEAQETLKQIEKDENRPS